MVSTPEDVYDDVRPGTDAADRPGGAVGDRLTAPGDAAARKSATLDRRRFSMWLAVILVVAAGIRIWSATGPMANRGIPIDAKTERAVAQTWADGGGLTVTGADGTRSPSTDHVPIHVTALMILDRLHLQTPEEQRIALGLLSLIGVAAVALIGWQLDRPAVGLVAASIAAADPIWFQPATNLMAEGIFLSVVPVVLLAAAWCRRRPTWARLVLLGVAIGVAGLTRSEAIVLLPAVAIPVAVLASTGVRRKLLAAGAVVLAFSVVVAPWLVRNHHEVDAWILSTNQGGSTLGASCDASFQGDRAGGWVAECFIDGIKRAVDPVTNPHPAKNSAQLSAQLQTEALDYEKAHASDLPQIVALRVGRTWGVARVGDTLWYDTQEDRVNSLQWIGYAIHWLLMPLTVVGMLLLSRGEWRRWWILVPPIVATTIVTAAFWGTPRFRSGAEASLVLFSAFAIVEGGSRLFRERSRVRATA